MLENCNISWRGTHSDSSDVVNHALCGTSNPFFLYQGHYQGLPTAKDTGQRPHQPSVIIIVLLNPSDYCSLHAHKTVSCSSSATSASYQIQQELSTPGMPCISTVTKTWSGGGGLGGESSLKDFIHLQVCSVLCKQWVHNLSIRNVFHHRKIQSNDREVHFLHVSVPHDKAVPPNVS